MVAIGDTTIIGVDDLLRSLRADTIGTETAVELVSRGERRTTTVVPTKRS